MWGSGIACGNRFLKWGNFFQVHFLGNMKHCGGHSKMFTYLLYINGDNCI